MNRARIIDWLAGWENAEPSKTPFSVKSLYYVLYMLDGLEHETGRKAVEPASPITSPWVASPRKPGRARDGWPPTHQPVLEYAGEKTVASFTEADPLVDDVLSRYPPAPTSMSQDAAAAIQEEIARASPPDDLW